MNKSKLIEQKEELEEMCETLLQFFDMMQDAIDEYREQIISFQESFEEM